VLSSLAGFAWNLSGLPLPGFADQTLALLGQTALPAGLLSVGAAMKLERGQGPLSAHAWWLRGEVGRLSRRSRWASPGGSARVGPDAAVLVLCAALPTATNAYILAVRMTGDGRAVALQVTVGTVLSMATLPVWMALV
jgi:predicted permease